MEHEIIDHSLKYPYIRLSKSYRPSEDSSVAWHFHEDVEIIRIEDGTKDIYLNNSLYTLKKNDVIFINEYTPHKTYTPKGTKTFLLQFNTRDFNKSPTPLKENPSFFILDGSSEHSEEILRVLRDIEAEYEGKEAAFEMFIQAYVYKLLAIFHRIGIFGDTRVEVTGEKQERLLPVLEYVRSHYSENISLEDASRLLALNKSYFCRLFKSCIGMPFTDHLYKIRLDAAEKMLLHSNKTITEIAYEVGFSSPAYFTKIFRDRKGYPPSFYKKLQRR